MNTFLEQIHESFKEKTHHLYRGGLYDYHQRNAEEGLKLGIQDYDGKALIWHNIFHNHLPAKELLPKVSGNVIALELGCNTGYNVKHYEKVYGHAVGIDSNERLIAASKLNSPNCYVMRAEALDMDDESFSVVLAKDVFEHCKYPDMALSEAYRVLADGGYILAMIPLDGEGTLVDDVAIHDCFNYNNFSHTWKATPKGVIARFFRHGFTDLEIWMYRHSEIFGEARGFGDTVYVVRARKQEGLTKLPLLWLYGNPYWAAFLTFLCTGNCDYCIQHLSKDEFIAARSAYNRNMLRPDEWLKFFNGVQKWKNQQLGIIGGEPTVYPGFFELINGLEGFSITVTSNLTTPAFKSIPEFVSRLGDLKKVRLNTSFHPEITSVDEFARKIHQLRELGVNVDQIAMVAHPLSNYKKYNLEFLRRGINLAPQTYLGKYHGNLLPIDKGDFAYDFGEHEITDEALYRQGFSYEEKKNVMCRTQRFMVAPDGGIYKCHYLMYSRKNPLGNIKDPELPDPNAYDLCREFGFCNPCDFPHASFKDTRLHLKNELANIVKEPDMVEALWSFFTDHTEEEFMRVVHEIAGILYCSDDPYWSLYNDHRIRTLINDYLSGTEVWDNTKERYFAQLDGSLFRFLPAGVNVFRILDEIPLLKYIDALGQVIFTVLSEHHPSTKKVVAVPELTRALDTYISNTQATVGTAYREDGSFCIWKKVEGVGDGKKE